jgi:ankyrin repeat protein
LELDPEIEALRAAIAADDLGGVEALVREYPALASARHPDGPSLLMVALYSGKTRIAGILAAHGAEIDVFDAAALGDLERLNGLLTGDPVLANSWSADGFQPLHLAAYFGHPSIVTSLLERGVEPDSRARHPFGVTPLHSVVACGNSEKAQTMTQALVSRGANVNARQGGIEDGFTPLMGAAQSGDAVLVERLLTAGAAANARTGDGKTAADYAREKGHDAVATLLDGHLLTE